MGLLAILHAKFLDPAPAFDHPATVVIVSLVAVVLGLGYAVTLLLHRSGRIDEKLYRELMARLFSWALLVPMIMTPLLLGPGWWMAAVLALALLCYREFARLTGLFREHMLSLVVVSGIVLVHFAAFDHWYGFFAALAPLTVITIVAVAVIPDQPSGYIQRVALAIFAFLLFGVCFGHLAYIANDQLYRPILLMLIVTVEMNDVFAYVSGKLFGRRRLAPRTSPGKTVAGALGAMAGTTVLVTIFGGWIFRATIIAQPFNLLLLGIIISVAGQLGDLTLSSIKRDLGVKDAGSLLPGHGGLLDRFDSLILVAPAFFHYIGYFQGFGLDQPVRILSGGGG